MPANTRGLMYAPSEGEDDYSVLVDHVWLLGVKEADAAVDTCTEKGTPIEVLRKWFHHDPEKWEEFKRR